MLQPKLPIYGVMYECANPDCFYCESMMTFEDVTWKPLWNSEIEDLDLVPHCASCGEPMMIWRDDGTL